MSQRQGPETGCRSLHGCHQCLCVRLPGADTLKMDHEVCPRGARLPKRSLPQLPAPAPSPNVYESSDHARNLRRGRAAPCGNHHGQAPLYFSEAGDPRKIQDLQLLPSLRVGPTPEAQGKTVLHPQKLQGSQR